MSGFVPTGNPNPSHARAERSPEHLLSNLLLGFVERNVSPHTICDIVKSQVVESRLPAQVLSTPTCNGIIEVLTASAGVTGSLDVLLFLATRPGFPSFLSGRALSGLVVFFLKQISVPVVRLDPQRQHRIAVALDSTARRIVTEMPHQCLAGGEKTRILNALKTLPEEIRTWVDSTAPSLGALRTACGNESQGTIAFNTPILANPSDVLTTILEAGEHLLAQKGVSFYRASPLSVSLEWRSSNVDAFLDIVGREGLSDFRRAFLTEWFFDGMLRETLHNPDYTSTLQRLARSFVDRYGENDAVLKGLLRGLQRDLSFTATELGSPDAQNPQLQQLQQRASLFFTAIFPVVCKDVSRFTKTFAQWALQVPVHPAESRLFTRSAWHWLGTLATNQWEDSLREPPPWVTTQASRFAAAIFRMAPAFWLQDHGHALAERLHLESIQAGFNSSSQHLDYVEFLVRTLRRKSPFFASRSELLLALKLAGRASPQEENQLRILETRYRMNAAATRQSDPERQLWSAAFGEGGIDRFGSNPVTRTLHVLLQTLRIAAKNRKVGNA